MAIITKDLADTSILQILIMSQLFTIFAVNQAKEVTLKILHTGTCLGMLSRDEFSSGEAP